MVKQVVFIIAFSLLQSSLYAQLREKQSLNSGWRFLLNDNNNIASTSAANWQFINLPHTWNALDIVDDTLGYHQGIGWYKKEISIPASYQSKHVELHFEGACNKAIVYVNGQHAGDHIGGFTAFTVNLDGRIKYGEKNEVLVMVDNSKYLRDSVPPFSADFNMIGGIYRDVWLIATNTARFAKRYGADEVYFTTPSVSEQSASFIIKGKTDSAPANASIVYSLKDNNNIVATSKQRMRLRSTEFVLNGMLANPKLWSPETPQLYQLQVQLINAKNEVLDELQMNVGFRWFGIDAQQQFTLNGKPYKLKGAARHQDYHLMGNALTDAMHVRDLELMKEMGCNFIRISHYPQDPAVYEACDRLGLISWSEIPVVDRYVDNETFNRNTKEMMQEMVLQNFNHPSVAIWGYHNEVRNLEEVTVKNARTLDSIAKALDPQRLTAIAFEANIDAPYFKTNPLLKDMLNIADINGYNIYQGWYRGRHQTIGSFLDTMHRFNPAKPIMLSEYGAGSLINLHSYNTSLFDFTEEYQVEFNRSYVEAGMQRPWMVGFSIWNFIDFQRDGREDVKPHINKKGMVTTDRQPKDVFYYYKSQWSPEPFLNIAGKHWPKRIAVTANDTLHIPLTVFSNQNHLALFKNGKPVATQVSENGVFEWMVEVREGNNLFECRTVEDSLADVLNIEYRFINPTTFSQQFPAGGLLANTGQTRTYFTDPASNEQWMPDKAYTPGTWGYVGGEIWNTWPGAAWNNIREGIHRPIANTANEPLFQTFVQGLSAWKADVPDGKYRVTVLLAEPFTENQRNNEERVMDINVNGQIWIQQLNMTKEYGIQTAIVLDKEITIKSGEGLTIGFTSSAGKTILNGVSIEKL